MMADISNKEHWIKFGEWLSAQRHLLGKSQSEMAGAAGMARSQWNRIENGKSGTKRVTIPRIAAAVQASLKETYKRAGFDAAFAPDEATPKDMFQSVLATLSKTDKEFIQNLAARLQSIPDADNAQKLPELNEGEELLILNRRTGSLYTLDRESITGDSLIELVTLLAFTLESAVEQNNLGNSEASASLKTPYTTSDVMLSAALN